MDPFRHHPGLRDLITPLEDSYFRTFDPAEFDARAQDIGLPPDWRHPDAVREAIRAEALSRRPPGDLWVFAYGSLMWDPALTFAEVRRAHLSGFARRFCLVVSGGRGTPDAPCAMAALMPGEGCDGLAFRVPEALIETETERLFRREAIAPGYLAVYRPVELPDGTVQALTFIGDVEAPDLVPDLPRETQVSYLATGAGELGTSLEYISALVRHFDELGIDDPDTRALYAEASALAASLEV